MRGSKEETVDCVHEEGRKIHIAGRKAFSECVVCVLVVRRRLEHRDVVPVCVHLFGEHHGQGRVHALAHFGMRNNGRHRVVRRYLDPHIENGFIFTRNERCNFSGSIAGTNRDADDDNTAGQHTGRDEGSPGPFSHGAPPAWRWYLQAISPHV